MTIILYSHAGLFNFSGSIEEMLKPATGSIAVGNKTKRVMIALFKSELLSLAEGIGGVHFVIHWPHYPRSGL